MIYVRDEFSMAVGLFNVLCFTTTYLSLNDYLLYEQTKECSSVSINS